MDQGLLDIEDLDTAASQFLLLCKDGVMTPILLGVVMGPILENRLRQALGGANGDLTIFISRPISALMLAAMAALVFFTFRGWLKQRKPPQDWQINDT